MKEKNLKIHPLYYYRALEVCVKKQDYVKGLIVLNLMETEEITPDVLISTSLLNLYLQSREGKSILSIFKAMRKEEENIEEVTCHTLVSTYMRSQYRGGSLRVVQEMEKQNLWLHPFNSRILFNLYINQQEKEDALVVLQAIEKTGLQPNEKKRMLDEVFSLCIRVQDPEGAVNVINRMKQADLKVDRMNYNVIFNLCKRNQDLFHALVLVKYMEKEGLNPEKVMYDEVIFLFILNKNLRSAAELFDQYFSSEYLMQKENGYDKLHGGGLSYPLICMVLYRYFKLKKTDEVFLIQLLTHKKSINLCIKQRINDFLKEHYPYFSCEDHLFDAKYLICKPIHKAV